MSFLFFIIKGRCRRRGNFLHPPHFLILLNTNLMKNLQIVLALLVLCTTAAYSQGHFKIRNDEFIHVGYGTQKSITFGNQAAYSPDNGLYAMEA
jgi:hypothetical protein